MAIASPRANPVIHQLLMESLALFADPRIRAGAPVAAEPPGIFAFHRAAVGGGQGIGGTGAIVAFGPAGRAALAHSVLVILHPHRLLMFQMALKRVEILRRDGAGASISPAASAAPMAVIIRRSSTASLQTIAGHGRTPPPGCRSPELNKFRDRWSLRRGKWQSRPPIHPARLPPISTADRLAA